MLPAGLASETVIRLRGTGVADAHANTVVDFTSPAQSAIAGCSVQPMQGDESLLGRDSVTSRWQWFGPPDADVRSDDRIRYRGKDYEVDGSVQDWVDPTGAGLDHRFAYLKLVEG